MTLEIPDQMVQQTGSSEQEIRLSIAIALFSDGIFTLGQAAKFAGLHQIQMQRELAQRNIPLHYGQEEYELDKRTIGLLP